MRSLLLIFVFLIASLQSGLIASCKSELCDVSGHPVLSMSSINGISCNIAWYLDDGISEFDLRSQPFDAITFRFGNDSLSNYIAQQCHNSIVTNKYCTKDLRQHVLYAVLFDKAQEIVDFRIIICYDYDKIKSFVPIIKKALVSIKNMWQIKNTCYDYYAFIGEFWLK